MPRLSLLVLLGLGVCGPHPDLAADRAELLRLHEQARTAHLQKRADLMAFPDSLLEIARGTVKVRSAADNAARFPEHTIYAWLEVYEKRQGKWTLAVVVSTDRPGTA